MSDKTVNIDPPEASFEIRVTASEVEQLAALLDLATKAGGLRVATAALFFMQKFQTGLQNAIVPASGIPKPPTPLLHR